MSCIHLHAPNVSCDGSPRCGLCNQFHGKGPLTATIQRRKQYVPKFKWQDLLNSASSGCYCCDILVRGSRGCFAQHQLTEGEIEHGCLRFWYLSCTVDIEDQEVDKQLIFTFRDSTQFFIEIFMTPDTLDPTCWDPGFVGRSRTSPRTNSEAALATINGWLADCISTNRPPKYHCELQVSPTLPTRVVDVRTGDGDVRLVEPNGATSQYACLSHCWGNKQIITTTKATLEEHKKCIPWERLSQTFQDAVWLVRKLGMQYIWIDSLCIIQDDIRDWQVESSKMASVYRNGHFTIAATQSRDDVEICGKTPEGEEYHLYCRKVIDHHLEYIGDTLPSPDGPEGHPSHVYYPVLTRAWVYQERMLSTRVIHFGRYEVFFECNTDIQCECGWIQTEGYTATTRMMVKAEFASTLSALNFGYYTEGESYHADAQYYCASLWRTVALAYKGLRLTQSSDRLPAIGGLAREMAGKRKARYLAGLWEDSLLDDLIWQVPASAPQLTPYSRNAPSWSWASVESRIRYWDERLFTGEDDDDENWSVTGFARDRMPYQHYSTVERCHVQPSGVDEYGPLAGGSLVITGLIVEGVLEYSIDAEGKSNTTAPSEYHISFPHTRKPMGPDYLIAQPGPGQTKPGAPGLCLRMSTIQESQAEFLVSLVLRQSPERQGCFERIGTVVDKASPPPVDPMGGISHEASQRTVTIV
ncbi:heterokaryon incompatibility protein-domain-containing protein [Aspergillus carlsbadensis]|nr:heterokaryon incompatibility protein-domain-containing protein [Aspergillus carlsbadensis]